ncbi:hypothetical protein N7478_011404 [Penicillium angulare]|uniref:uncharacterized protein n=1 Tax=Penicillium angulare TaxID=116970 RepID=UPI0025421F8A|nr:uncharacterized protein N7478_011404 [Penicillium angulare]KAJ5263799.1 hypothetical protein N7478_011404 [Penicillium angulare]
MFMDEANQKARWDASFLEDLSEQEILMSTYLELTLSSSVHGLSGGFDISHGSERGEGIETVKKG